MNNRNDLRPPLAGGQGRDRADVTDSALILLWVMIACISALVVCGIVAFMA